MTQQRETRSIDDPDPRLRKIIFKAVDDSWRSRPRTAPFYSFDGSSGKVEARARMECLAGTFSDLDDWAVLAVRKRWIQEREYWLAEQKSAVDKGHARFCKEMWKEARQNVMAVCLIAGQACSDIGLPGDCKTVPVEDFPKELVSNLNRAWGEAFLLTRQGE